MKVLVITGNPKKSGALAELTAEAVKGAGEAGAEVEEIRLAEKEIGQCRFCLKCLDEGPDIMPCAQKDDMEEIIEKIREADGYIMACPASGGHASGYMRTFIERTTWTLGSNTRRVLWVKGCPESRIADRQRYAVILTTAGVVPGWSRFFCYGSMREMSQHAKGMFSARIVGRLFAGPVFERGITDRDRETSRELGRSLATNIELEKQ